MVEIKNIIEKKKCIRTERSAACLIFQYQNTLNSEIWCKIRAKYNILLCLKKQTNKKKKKPPLVVISVLGIISSIAESMYVAMVPSRLSASRLPVYKMRISLFWNNAYK